MSVPRDSRLLFRAAYRDVYGSIAQAVARRRSGYCLRTLAVAARLSM